MTDKIDKHYSASASSIRPVHECYKNLFGSPVEARNYLLKKTMICIEIKKTGHV